MANFSTAEKVSGTRSNGLRWKGWILESLLVAVLYAITGRMGFFLAISPGNVTAIWPPSGIAFAAILVFGYRAWFGVWLGSFLLNIWFLTKFANYSTEGVSTALAIAIGSTLQAVVGGYLLRRTIASNNFVDNPQAAFKFVSIGAISCLIAATIGVTSLCLAGLVNWSQYAYTWLTWWCGDLAGVLVVTPFVLTWYLPPSYIKRPRSLTELLALLFILAVICQILFKGLPFLGMYHYPLSFILFPFLIWVARRFGASGVTAAALVIEIVVALTARHGYQLVGIPYLANRALLLLMAFLGLVSLTALSLVSVFSEWQQSRQKLETLAQQLETRIKERTIDLEQANRDLRLLRDQAIEASKSKSAFIANISHELRTPLSGIIGTSELLLGADGAMAEKDRALLKTLHDSALALVHMVNDVLDLAKLEAGKIVLHDSPFDIVDLVQGSARLMASAADRKGLVITTNIDERIPKLLLGDQERVRQTLLNLVSNAIKFTDKGEISIQALLGGENGTSVTIRFQVQDTGVGISEDEQKLLFKPFTQVDYSETRKYGGTGLGLSICKQLVDVMGGDIGMASKKGQGSLFWFTLPLQKCTEPLRLSAAPGPTTGPARVLPEGAWVLIVDDSDLICSLVAQQLSTLGVKSHPARNGKEAITAVTDRRYDLILMDCQMPELDGYEATRRIRNIEARTGTHTPIVALTASAMESDEQRCRSAGMDDYLTKPVRINDLTRMLEHWLAPSSAA